MKILWLIMQIIISISFGFPAVLLLISLYRKNIIFLHDINQPFQSDFGIIVTAYKQIDLIADVVNSILKSTYSNYIIYVVADACDISTLSFNDERVVLLQPEGVLASNTRSHFYAINKFIRNHNVITIIDSDNLVEDNYLDNLNQFFKKGYMAIQGVRKARNLNTIYACLDEAGDIFYRFIDRKLLFEAGSSASLAGSGMAFTTEVYKECLKKLDISGAGFDKVLQYELVNRKQIIVFAQNAIVYDAKTTKSDQLVKQRARWINTWFKYWILAFKLFLTSIIKPNWNQFAFAVMLLRPPLFLLFFIAFLIIIIDIFVAPVFLIYWSTMFILFISVFFIALKYFKADKKIYKSLLQSPKFIFYQVIALFKAKLADKLSVATTHNFKG